MPANKYNVPKCSKIKSLPKYHVPKTVLHYLKRKHVRPNVASGFSNYQKSQFDRLLKKSFHAKLTCHPFFVVATCEDPFILLFLLTVLEVNLVTDEKVFAVKTGLT